MDHVDSTPEAKLDLAGLQIDAKVVRLIPHQMARRFKLIAVAQEDDALVVAMEDPLDVIATDTISASTGYHVKATPADSVEIQSAIDKYYTEAIDIAKTMRNIVDVEVETSDRSDADDEQLSIEPNDAPVIRLVNLILLQAIQEGASDIHIEPRERDISVRFRVDGVLRNIIPPPKPMQWAITSRIKILSGLNISERRLPQDGSCRVRIMNRRVDIRVSTIPTLYGEKVVMRLLDKANLKTDFAELGFDEAALATIKHAIEQPHGMVLLTGPTGSGKTTTLYSALTHINSPDKNIMTVEDPVEYELEGINQVQAKPMIGLDFAAALRSFLRQDPDVVLVGEIRDLETASIAIKAAQTGHLVFSTLHTNDATTTVDRLLNMGVEPYLVCSSLNLVIAQRLVRRICERCKEPYEPERALVTKLHEHLPDAGDVTFYRGAGCPACGDSGYKGRMALYELFPITRRVREMVLESVVGGAIRDEALAGGMKPLATNGMEKVREGLTTIDEVMRATTA
jgi:type IV pilus assembly protein PilB